MHLILLRCKTFYPLIVRSADISGRAVYSAAQLLGLWVRIPLDMEDSLSCEYRVLSGRGSCVGLTPRSEHSYGMLYI